MKMGTRTGIRKRLTAIDLFAGGGGLTVGLKEAGVRVISAVEIEPHALATYKANHPEVLALQEDVRAIKGKHLLKKAPIRGVDILAGCPPCQGFSSLTSKYKRIDPRNDLILEMARLIEETQPRAVMMENVPGLPTKGEAYFQRFLKRMEDAGYKCTWDVLQVADYGVPQHRRRFVLLAGKGFEIPLPESTHSRTGESGKPRWRDLHSVIYGLPSPVKFSEAKALGGASKVKWNVIRDISPENQRRLEAAVPGKDWSAIPRELRPPCHRGSAVGFGNAYGRMTWDQVPVTMTGGCTTPSKGRFGHPDEPRTLSVREAALIQTFPPDYLFDSPYIDKVCDIIGNALPCDFATALTLQVAKHINTALHQQAVE